MFLWHDLNGTPWTKQRWLAEREGQFIRPFRASFFSLKAPANFRMKIHLKGVWIELLAPRDQAALFSLCPL